MQVMSKKKMSKAVPALMAAAFGGWAGVPLAHANFVLSIDPNPQVFGGNTEYVVSAINNGIAPVGGLPTGSTIAAVDLTITTPGSGTSGALVIDLADFNGDGKTDANVDGTSVSPSYSYSDSTSYSPVFGAKTVKKAYTMIGIASAPEPSTTTSAPAVDVYVNGQTASNNSGFEGTPAVYLTSPSNPTIDPAFTSNTVHALEVVAKSSATPVASSTPIPVANIVVPTGTSFSVTGSLGGEIGLAGTVSISNVTTASSGAKLTLTTTAPVGVSAGTLNLTGSNGSYAPAKITGITGPASITGYVQVTGSGFNPATDEEVFALAVDSNGVLASGSTTSTLAQIVSDLQAGAPAGVTVEALTSTPPVGPNITGIFNPAAWNVEVVESTGVGMSPYLGYDFSTDTTNPNTTITAVGVVPEPTGVGVLVLGGMGLMARRRRMAKGLVA